MSLLIITSTFNREHLLLRTINSVKDAFGKKDKYLHVVINDSMVPLSSSILTKSSNKLIFYQNDANLGKNRSVHHAILKFGAGFTYALSLDDDDILLEGISNHDYVSAQFAIIAHPKLIIPQEGGSAKVAVPPLSKKFPSAIDLVADQKGIEISFALRIDTYKRLANKIRPLISRSGPELAIYDIVSRESGGVLFQDYPVMACEYHLDGMTAGFRRRVRQYPEDFLAYYFYMLRKECSWRRRVYFFSGICYCLCCILLNLLTSGLVRKKDQI